MLGQSFMKSRYNWGSSLSLSISPQEQTPCYRRNGWPLINSNIAKQATRTLHENSKLALDHGLLAMPSSSRHLFWHFHRRSPHVEVEGRRKNLSMMAVGATMVDGCTVLLFRVIWTEPKQTVISVPIQLWRWGKYGFCNQVQSWLSVFNSFIPEQCNLWPVVCIQFQCCFEWIDFARHAKKRHEKEYCKSSLLGVVPDYIIISKNWWMLFWLKFVDSEVLSVIFVHVLSSVKICVVRIQKRQLNGKMDVLRLFWMDDLANQHVVIVNYDYDS